MENFYGCIFCKLYCLGATTLQLTSTDSDIDSQSSVGDETNKNRTRGFVSDCMSSFPTSTKYRHRMRRKMQYKSKNNNKTKFRIFAFVAVCVCEKFGKATCCLY